MEMPGGTFVVRRAVFLAGGTVKLPPYPEGAGTSHDINRVWLQRDTLISEEHCCWGTQVA